MIKTQTTEEQTVNRKALSKMVEDLDRASDLLEKIARRWKEEDAEAIKDEYVNLRIAPSLHKGYDCHVLITTNALSEGSARLNPLVSITIPEQIEDRKNAPQSIVGSTMRFFGSWFDRQAMSMWGYKEGD